MAKVPVEIVCSACGEDTFVRREPLYDGFVKKGEVFVCSSCGHRYESEAEVPFKQAKKVSIFTDADKFKKVEIFKSDDFEKNCRHCRHYVVNPFTQRCGLHNRIVQATDLCGQFEKAVKEEDKNPPGTPES